MRISIKKPLNADLMVNNASQGSPDYVASTYTNKISMATSTSQIHKDQTYKQLVGQVDIVVTSESSSKSPNSIEEIKYQKSPEEHMVKAESIRSALLSKQNSINDEKQRSSYDTSPIESINIQIQQPHPRTDFVPMNLRPFFMNFKNKIERNTETKKQSPKTKKSELTTFDAENRTFGSVFTGSFISVDKKVPTKIAQKNHFFTSRNNRSKLVTEPALDQEPEILPIFTQMDQGNLSLKKGGALSLKPQYKPSESLNTISSRGTAPTIRPHSRQENKFERFEQMRRQIKSQQSQYRKRDNIQNQQTTPLTSNRTTDVRVEKILTKFGIFHSRNFSMQATEKMPVDFIKKRPKTQMKQEIKIQVSNHQELLDKYRQSPVKLPEEKEEEEEKPEIKMKQIKKKKLNKPKNYNFTIINEKSVEKLAETPKSVMSHFFQGKKSDLMKIDLFRALDDSYEDSRNNFRKSMSHTQVLMSTQQSIRVIDENSNEEPVLQKPKKVWLKTPIQEIASSSSSLHQTVKVMNDRLVDILQKSVEVVDEYQHQDCPKLEGEIKKLKTQIIQHVVTDEIQKYTKIKVDEPCKKFQVYEEFPVLFRIDDCPQQLFVEILSEEDLKIAKDPNPKMLSQYLLYPSGSIKLEICSDSSTFYLSILGSIDTCIKIIARLEKPKIVKTIDELKKEQQLSHEEIALIDQKLKVFYEKNKHLLDIDTSGRDRIQEYVDNFMISQKIEPNQDKKYLWTLVVLERAKQMQKIRRNERLDFQKKWHCYKIELFKAKNELVKQYKRKYLAKRVISLVQLTQFARKLNVLLEMIKKKVRYKEALLTAGVITVFKMKKQLKSFGPNLPERYRRRELRMPIVFQAIGQFDLTYSKAEEIFYTVLLKTASNKIMQNQGKLLNQKVIVIQRFWQKRRQDRNVEQKYLRNQFEKQKKFIIDYFAKKSSSLAKKVQKSQINIAVINELLKYYQILKQAQSLREFYQNQIKNIDQRLEFLQFVLNKQDFIRRRPIRPSPVMIGKLTFFQQKQYYLAQIQKDQIQKQYFSIKLMKIEEKVTQMETHIFYGSIDTIKATITQNLKILQKSLTKHYKKKKIVVNFKQFVCQPNEQILSPKSNDFEFLEKMETKQDKLIDIDIKDYHKEIRGPSIPVLTRPQMGELHRLVIKACSYDMKKKKSWLSAQDDLPDEDTLEDLEME